jgi:hypothetical protein
MQKRTSYGVEVDNAARESISISESVLIAEHEILRALVRYSYAVDYGPCSEYVDCFTSDGVFEVEAGENAPEARRIEGRSQLAEYFRSREAASVGVAHMHAVGQPRIKFHDDHADVESYYVTLRSESGEPALGSFGRYEDRMVKGSDGQWRFKSRLVKSAAYRG